MNTEIPKKIRGNAMASYGLVFASLAFLISKDPKLNHPFVKSHTKVAFVLHCILLFILFIMSYPFLRTIKIYTLTLNDIITAILGLIIFGGIAYGASKAYKGETVTLGDMLHKVTKKEGFASTSKYQAQSEYDTSLLILGHIPFIGYVFSAQNKENVFLRDIALFNLIITVFCLILVFFGFVNIAAIFFLLYIIWSFFVSVRLIYSQELTRIDISFIPTPSEGYILLQAIGVYIKNMFDKNTFVELSTLKKRYEQARILKEEKNEAILLKKSIFQYSPTIISIPFINIISIFYNDTQEKLRILNGIILSIVLVGILVLYGPQSPIFLIALIPFCYHAGYHHKKAYHMPIITDIVLLFSYIGSKIFKVGKKTRELQKKEVSGSFGPKETHTVKKED